MTLRCPKCGNKRLVFLSTTDGTAIGSTDQRYLCKDCGYRGSLVVETEDRASKPRTHKTHSGRAKFFQDWQKVLVMLDVVLFAAVLVLLAAGWVSSFLGLAVLFVWVGVFLVTLVSFSIQISQGSEEWYQYGAMLTTGVLIAMVVGLLAGFDVYGVTLIMPFAVMVVLVINWMFMDRSEEEIDRDLERLRREIK